MQASSNAKVKLEAGAAQRHAAEQAEYELKKAERQAKAQATGGPPKGLEPKPPEPGVRDSDQINLIDEESRIIPASGKGFQQAYNAQAGVERKPADGHRAREPKRQRQTRSGTRPKSFGATTGQAEGLADNG